MTIGMACNLLYFNKVTYLKATLLSVIVISQASMIKKLILIYIEDFTLSFVCTFVQFKKLINIVCVKQ